MNKVIEIRKLKELLEPVLNGHRIRDYSTKYLTPLGENYGSTILALSAATSTDDVNLEVFLNILHFLSK